MLSEAVICFAAVCGTLEIMPMGDSLTAGEFGVSPPISYRYVLDAQLEAAGIQKDFVGERSRGCDYFVDCQHQSEGGWKIETLTAESNSAFATFDPDMVLLLVGTNNHWQEPSYAEYYAKYSALLDVIGDRTVIMSTVPKFGYDRPDKAYWRDAWVDERNLVRFPLMNQAIDELAGQRENVQIVDLYSLLDPELHLGPDRLHFNQAGSELLASLFADAITTQMAAIPEPSPLHYGVLVLLMGGITWGTKKALLIVRAPSVCRGPSSWGDQGPRSRNS